MPGGLRVSQKKKWNNIFKVPKEKTCYPKILYQIKIFFNNKGEIKAFSIKGKVRKLVVSRLALNKFLKKALQTMRMLQEETCNIKNKGKAKEMITIYVI